jgi:ligand-binding sensor domain-containing protein
MTKRDYLGKPVEMKETLQRLAIRQTREANPERVKALESLPKTALSAEQTKRLPDFLTPAMVTCVYEDANGVLWLGTNEGLWRVNEKETEQLDRVQCFRAMAYMLDNEVQAVDGDGDNGVYVLTKTSVSHIAMKWMSAKEKAVFLSDVDMKICAAQGYAQRRALGQ